MDDEKIAQFPISEYQRWKNRVGKFGVPCMVSDRWLQFPAKSSGHFENGEYIEINVMTQKSDEKPHKLCSLVATREDLLRVINSIQSPLAAPSATAGGPHASAVVMLPSARPSPEPEEPEG